MFPGAAEAALESPARLSVSRLALTQFRSYETARLEADGRPVVLFGENGAGKTNLLEALSFLTPGRGLRRARLAECDRLGGEGPWGIAATVEGPRGPVRLGTGREAGEDRRTIRIDGANAKGQAALAEHVNVVWLTPQMDGLFRESAGNRRRFLDRLVWGFDPEHASRVTIYDNALRERARLLREGRGDPAWLGALEDRMARYGVAIAAARRDVAHRVDAACAAAHGPFPRARLAAVGAVETFLDEGPALAAEDRLREGLAASRRQDGETGGAAIGPHRSDLAVTHPNGVAAPHCSTGEQKALLVAILLAHARLQSALRGATPLLLLDEVAAHLDELRRRALFEALIEGGAQAWLTGTDASVFAPLAGTAQFVKVASGQLSVVSD
jgi:DNA replication and repair protein RecF